MDTDNSIGVTLVKFMTRLEEIGHQYAELYDTDVREAIHLTLNYFFVWGMPVENLPRSFRMFSHAADLAVAEAVASFLREAKECEQVRRTRKGRDRLDLLQDEDVQSKQGRQFDEFFGFVEVPLPADPPPPELYVTGF